MEKVDNIIFDNSCRIVVISILDKMENMCLKDRENCWMIIYGFIGTHLKWFDNLKYGVDKHE